ncbi:pyridoxal kinase [Powellomyces hirtus]|uniref:pyridoxal kinase n=1 Tax=Powellomyces hirtus TaxID=109895 RepID=A0A507E9M8_9FUNG|nr:pyridoxal kinase [Powellomyces hirtus]
MSTAHSNGTAGRVLSIQSHVVHGYVGNKAATFPLQCLGYDVDPINAVHFSNHSGYPTMHGTRLTPPEFAEIVRGLAVNGIVGEYSHLLTGYVGQAQTLSAIPALLHDLRAVNPALLYLLDPVMGDNGKLYVPADVLPVYRDLLCPLADVMTPNGFEAGLLAGTSITSKATLQHALQALHALGPSLVIITSTPLSDFAAAAAAGAAAPPTTTTAAADSETNYLVASHPPSQTRFAIPFTKRPGFFTGTGDLFAALVLAFLDARRVRAAAAAADGETRPPSPTPSPTTTAPTSGPLTAHIRAVCVAALTCMSHVLDETAATTAAKQQAHHSSVVSHPAPQGDRTPAFMRSHELAIVQSRRWFVKDVAAAAAARDSASTARTFTVIDF